LRPPGAVAFDELIEGANILRGLGLADFSEGQAREAAKKRQAEMQRRDQEDRENPSRQGQRTDLVQSEKNDMHEVKGRPHSGSVEGALRRLRKDRTDLHARALAGELTLVSKSFGSARKIPGHASARPR
jgi:hypothetical protein